MLALGFSICLNLIITSQLQVMLIKRSTLWIGSSWRINFVVVFFFAFASSFFRRSFVRLSSYNGEAISFLSLIYTSRKKLCGERDWKKDEHKKIIFKPKTSRDLNYTLCLVFFVFIFFLLSLHSLVLVLPSAVRPMYTCFVSWSCFFAIYTI